MSEPQTARQPSDAADTSADTNHAPTPREVLRLYHRAMAAKSADALADLYAVDAVHEYPFFMAKGPSRYRGREALREGYRTAWADHPLEVDVIEDVFVHEGADPEIVVGQWQLFGVVKTTSRPVAITGLLVLRVRNGRIVHALDFMDGMGVANALGRLPFSALSVALPA